MPKRLSISKLSVESYCLKILINSDADVRRGAKLTTAIQFTTAIKCTTHTRVDPSVQG